MEIAPSPRPYLRRRRHAETTVSQCCESPAKQVFFLLQSTEDLLVSKFLQNGCLFNRSSVRSFSRYFRILFYLREMVRFN